MRTSTTTLKALTRSVVITGCMLSLHLSSGASAMAQSKPTISIPEFKNTTSWWWWRNGTSRELADALSNELNATGNFSIVERQKLDSVLSEQELAELGLVTQETAAPKGQLTGAKYIVLGRVTSFEEGVEGVSNGRRGGVNVFGVRIGRQERNNKQKAYVAIDLRVVNSTTGEVVHSRTVEGKATSESNSGSTSFGIRGLNLGEDQSQTKKVPVGKALRAALIEATDYLSCVMVEQDGCVAEFQQKDDRRRDNTRGVLELD